RWAPLVRRFRCIGGWRGRPSRGANERAGLDGRMRILLASADPTALRAWYERAFDVHPNPDGFLPFGTVDLLITARDDVAPMNPEPGRSSSTSMSMTPTRRP